MASANNPDLHTQLAQLGLDQYEQRLIDNGFDGWEILMGITEADLSKLGFKLGHRRKLQRAITEQQGENPPGVQYIAYASLFNIRRNTSSSGRTQRIYTKIRAAKTRDKTLSPTSTIRSKCSPQT